MIKEKSKIEFGDFQTPYPLALSVCNLLKASIACPKAIIEPSCGKGSYLKAALCVFGDETEYFGFDINSQYVAIAKHRLAELQSARIFK